MGILANENSISAGGYTIERSLRFQSASSQYLSRTPSVSGSATTWTWSAWVKRGASAQQALFSAAASASAGTSWRFINDTLDIYRYNGSAYNYRLTTTQVFRDPSAWYHIVIAFDSTQATTSDRLKLYVNGVQVTAFSTATYPTASYAEVNGSGFVQYVGRSFAALEYLDGYQSEVNWIDGQALTPSSFGETDALTGVWVAKRYTGTYGTNGFYLPFNDGTSTTTLGQDRSGNSNNWTLTNFTRSAGVSDCWMYDVPSGNGGASSTQPSSNYAVWNPLKSLGGQWTYSRANLQVSYASNNNIWALSSIRIPTSGKWYWEITATVISSSLGFIGVLPDASADSNTVSHVGYYRSSGTIANLAGTLQTSGASYTNNDVIGIAVDVDAGTVQFYKNNTAQGASPSFTFTANQSLTPFVGGDNTAGTKTFDVNFGQRSFAYTPPSGFKALCTANLPAPTIAKGNQYMDAKLYTGIGATQTITGYNFQPELVWVKARSAAYDHKLVDVVRGLSGSIYRDLESNTTDVEGTPSDGISSLNSDGFTITGGGNPGYNGNTTTFVAWAWDAGSSTVTNTDGSITSQVRANTTAGFSIVTYTGTGANATVGHGLGIKPLMIIVKQRSAVQNWAVYANAAGGADRYLSLNTTSAYTLDSTVFRSIDPTSSVFSIGTSALVNANTGTYVAYCFAEIAGFSKFGSYTGNGSADGPFVYCGFRPKYVMWKRTNGVSSWVTIDSARDSYNVSGNYLVPNTSGAEATTPLVDFTSNGFKLRTNSAGNNGSGDIIIYMAFSETPFNYSNAR